MANWLTYRIKVGNDVLVLADEEARELIKNETERSKKADAQTASFLESTTSNGIIRNGKSDPFRQTAIGGMKVVIDEGDLIINGNIKNHARLTRTYNVMQENRTEVFLYRFDSVTNEITRLWRDCIIQGDIILSREDKTELPLRSSGYYDILICKITIPAGATEITQDMIGDFRQNEYYCGYAKNLLVEIDETLTKSDAAADAAAVGTAIGNLRKETRTRDIITEKRITNLEAGLPAERWSVDDSVAYIKDVPENALPFASVDMIGGMTRKCTNLFDFESWKTTAITINGSMTYGENSVTLSAINNDSYAVSDTAKVMVVPGKTYTISFEESDTTVSSDCHLFKNGQVDDSMLVYQDSPYTFVAADDAEFYTVRFGVSLAGNTLTFSNIRINEGNTVLPYEPYFDGLRSAPVTEVESVGVNLWDINAGIEHEVGCRVTIKTDGYEVTLDGTGGNYFVMNSSALRLEKDERYYFYSEAEPECRVDLWTQHAVIANGKGGFVHKDYDYHIELENTTPGQTYKVKVAIYKEAELNEFIPFIKNTLPVPAEVQALDGYGWGVNYAVYNYIDWEKKQFVKRVGRVDLGTLDWVLNYGVYFTTNIPGKAKGIRNFIVQNGEISPTYSEAFDDTFPYGTWGGDSAGNYVIYKAFNGEYADVTAFETAMSGVMLYYELATPVITDISDLLHEDNLIGVVGGGTVTPVNKHGYAVPSKITYQLKGAEA